MSGLPKELLASLGLETDASLELVASEEAPAGTGALGAGGGPLPVEALLGRPSPTLPVQMPELRTYGVTEAARLALDPAVILLDGPRKGVELFGGAKSIGEGAFALDSRQLSATLLVRGDEGDAILHAEAGGRLRLRVHRHALSEPMRALTRPIEPADAQPAVDVEAILGAASIQPWLVEEVRVLVASRSTLSRAVGVGLLARLGVPTTGAREALGSALRGEGLAVRAIGWARKLPPEQRAHLERLAVLEADHLSTVLSEVSDAVAADPAGAGVVVRQWLERRDDLASVAFLLERSGGTSELGKTLRDLDLNAQEHLTALGSARFDPGERLRAVSWQEPETWWGEFGLTT